MNVQILKYFGLKYFGIVLSIVTIIYISVSLTINFEGLYIKFNQQISEIGFEAKAGSIEVSHFPTPTVTLGDVIIPGKFEAKTLVLKFSIFSILTLNPTINLIEASDVTINSSGSTMINHGTAIINMFQLFPRIPDINLEKLSLINKQSGVREYIQSAKIRPNSNFNNIILHWDNKASTNISYTKNNNLEVQISTIAPSYKIDILETYDEGSKLLGGKIDYQIDNLKNYINNHYRDLDLLVTQVASNESVAIKCDFSAREDGINISNINLSSDSINMTGDANLFNNGKQDILNFHFSKMNLTKLLQTPDIDSIILSKNKEELKLQNLNSILNITADQILISGFDISKITLKASSDGTKLNIENCSGSIDEVGKFDLLGVVTQNQYRSKFDGKINISYPDANNVLSQLGYQKINSSIKSPITFTANIVATPIDYKFTNLYSKIGALNANGSAALKLIGTTPRLNLALNFSSINFDDKEETVITPITNYFKTLVVGMQDKDYLNKYIPLRKIGYLGNIDITLTNAIIAGDMVDKIHFICDAYPGILDFTSLYYQNGHNYLLGNGKLVSTGIKPLITLRIKDGEITDEALSFDKVITGISGANQKYSFEKVTLDFAIALKTLRRGDILFKNFYIAAINQDKLFNISGLQGYYNGGGFTSSGSIFLDSMKLTLSYAYSNFNINDLNVFYPMNIFGIADGWVSANGTVSTDGDTIDKFLYNLSTDSKFIASKVKWNGFDIDGLFLAINDKNYNPVNLEPDSKRFISSGVTNIEKIEGNFSTEHGIIKFTDVVLNTPKVSATALALYNIYTSNIDTTVKATFVLSPRVQYSNATNPVEVMIHTYGNISTPKKDVNMDNVRAVFEQKI